MAEKQSTAKELEEDMIKLGRDLIESYHMGNVNDNRLKLVEVIIKLYEVVKGKEVGKK